MCKYHRHSYVVAGRRSYMVVAPDGIIVIHDLPWQTVDALVRRLNGPNGAAYRRALDQPHNVPADVTADTALRYGHEF